MKAEEFEAVADVVMRVLFHREFNTAMRGEELLNLITQSRGIAFGAPRDEYAPVVSVTCETSVGLSFSGDAICCFTVVALIVQEPVQLVQDHVRKYW